jgi:hypothetical protein
VDAHPPSRLAFLRFAALVLACAGCFVVPAAAQAGDLIQLNGDPPVTLYGTASYGLLYLDGVVRLAGDAGINATDVFIGPDATLQTCYDSATNGANNCINGRSLGITASGGVAISPAIDLRGGVGPNRGGGTLIIRAARVSLGGTVETAGVASQSGPIVIESPGLVVTQTLHAPGANIIVRGGGGIVVGGDVWSAGDTAAGTEPGRDTNGGGIELTSSGGDVNVLGAIASWGHDVAAGALFGGRGGSVAVTGGEVRVSGGIDARPGRGVDNPAGPAGSIAVTARGSLVIAGPVDASGDASTTSSGSDGAPIALTAVGGISTGSLTSAGGASPLSGSNGGAITVSGAAVALGAVNSDASDATSDPANGSGGVGGSIVIKATATATTGALSARGGSGRGLGYGGAGGVVSVTGDRVTTGSVTTLGENLSASGGAVALRAQSGLLVAGAIDTAGAAGANSNGGGGGGPILLLAAHGPLTLGGRLRTEGGAGATASPQGARGGNGGAIEIVTSAIAASSGVLSGGGNAGNSGVAGGPRGAGGNGGRVRVWAQQPSLILLQLVDSGGGAGDPNGVDGPQSENAAPTTFTISKTRTLAFSSRAPEAEGYRIFASVGGVAATQLMTTKASGAALPAVAPCVKADYWLAAFNSGVAWQTDPIGPVSLTAAPSDTQTCTDAPQVTFLAQKIKKKLNPLRKKKWRVPVRFLADGMGNAHVVLSRKKKILAFVDKPLAAARRNVSVTLTIPKKLRTSGKFTVTVTGSAPVGKARSKSTLTLEVKK